MIYLTKAFLTRSTKRSEKVQKEPGKKINTILAVPAAFAYSCNATLTSNSKIGQKGLEKGLEKGY